MEEGIEISVEAIMAGYDEDFTKLHRQTVMLRAENQALRGELIKLRAELAPTEAIENGN